MTERGQLAIHAENILPIIKRWLYAEKEIFLRELVANACDALTKLQKIALVEELEGDPGAPRVDIDVNVEQGTITVRDNGIGMTAEEIRKYITQVAFSGVQDFVEKYRGQDESQQIIGHFGLGFYSAYMVAKNVEIDTLSYSKGAKAAHWSCDGSVDYVMTPSERRDVGTTITLHIDDESKDVLDVATLEAILKKYCAFMRHPIYLNGSLVNETHPAWTRSPSTLKDEDYLSLFRRVFPETPDPLFWIHLNLDYPFKLSGVLFFPTMRGELQVATHAIKLYCNQVFVADECKDLMPEYLSVLRGVLDCPDLPLNVSRSALQTDPTVRKIAQHVTKKIADKLSGMFRTERELYDRFWDDIHGVVKYGILRDAAFRERMMEFVVFKKTDGTTCTLDQYLELVGERTQKKILYATDPIAQSSTLKLFDAQDIPVLVAGSLIDMHFLPFLEMQSAGKYRFERIDSGIADILCVESTPTSRIVNPVDQKTDDERVAELFKKHLNRAGEWQVKVAVMKSPDVPGLVLQDENQRRLKDLARMGVLGPEVTGRVGQEGRSTLMINLAAPAVRRILELARSHGREEDVAMMVQHVVDLACLQQGAMTADEMADFVRRSNTLLGKVTSSPGIIL